MSLYRRLAEEKLRVLRGRVLRGQKKISGSGEVNIGLSVYEWFSVSSKALSVLDATVSIEVDGKVLLDNKDVYTMECDFKPTTIKDFEASSRDGSVMYRFIGSFECEYEE